MENRWNWEQKTLISELMEGVELAKMLKEQLGRESSVESIEVLVERILSSYEKAIMILRWSGTSTSTPQSQAQAQFTTSVPESPRSFNDSPRSDDLDGVFRENQAHNYGSKKRKALPTWTDRVTIGSQSGPDRPQEDGYNWRKYGQKDIFGAKYPRSYYRCTYRNTQNCGATKQVQRSEEDPTVFEVTYKGIHTCSQANQLVPPPASPENQERKLNHHSDTKKNKNNNNMNENSQQQQPQEILVNLRKGLSVDVDNLENDKMASPFSFPSTSAFDDMKSSSYYFSSSLTDDNNLLGGFSSSFASPLESGPNYFLISPMQMNNFGDCHDIPRSGSDLSELLSTNNSTANSPIFNVDFPLDPAETDLNLTFDTSEFSF